MAPISRTEICKIAQDMRSRKGFGSECLPGRRSAMLAQWSSTVVLCKGYGTQVSERWKLSTGPLPSCPRSISPPRNSAQPNPTPATIVLLNQQGTKTSICIYLNHISPSRRHQDDTPPPGEKPILITKWPTTSSTSAANERLAITLPQPESSIASTVQTSYAPPEPPEPLLNIALDSDPSPPTFHASLRASLDLHDPSLNEARPS
ncbi:hypothetical protein BCR34DRAFT_650841 [Clohesyomyces aquaticus]|uniref:Uncharacterized protein n=1 Tax=Clohesyomyces aquaticus TaxID=1231657 RepID=A0A1Y2A8H3_9PLEO|nr:hypothetical protein BCR34DRAFT_650841 [Clohesyomyces aquaticus]